MRLDVSLSSSSIAISPMMAAASAGGGGSSDLEFTVDITTGLGETIRTARVVIGDGTNEKDGQIDWGDGTIDTVTGTSSIEYSHVYADTVAEYNATISGAMHKIRMVGAATSCFRTRLKTVTNLGDLSYKNMERMFNDCDGMTSFAAGTTDTSAVTDMSSMFEDCANMTTMVYAKAITLL